MDDLPDPLFSPSKAAQAAELSLAWSETAHFLTPLFHPHPIPPFERNVATLNALLQLSRVCSAQTDHNALLAGARALVLEELQLVPHSTTITSSATTSNNHTHDTNTSDPTIAVLLSIASSLPTEAHTALNTLSSLPAALNSIHPHTPETMALSLSHLTRSESETAQQLARVESLHQQLKSEHALAQELLDKLRRESNSSTSIGASSREISGSGSAAHFQTPTSLMSKTGEWQRGSKQLGAKLGEYRECARRLEKSNHSNASNPRPSHHHQHGNSKSGTHGSIGRGGKRVQERELRNLEARVRGLEGRVRGFEGLPPDKEMALLEVERMRRELEGLVRKRDGMFEELIERGE